MVYKRRTDRRTAQDDFCAALADGYTLDRETGAVLAVVDPGETVVLRVAASSPAGETGTEQRVDTDTLANATVVGFRDRERYRRYDAYGRPYS